MEDNLGPPIASGRTADFHNWKDGQVLKLFHDWFVIESIQYERRINQAVYASGLPVPVIGELCESMTEMGGCMNNPGSTMWEMMHPWNVFRFARQIAELHAGWKHRHLHLEPAISCSKIPILPFIGLACYP